MKRRHATTTNSRTSRSTRKRRQKDDNDTIDDDDAAVGPPPAKRPRGRPRKKQPPQLLDPRQQISFYAVKSSKIIEAPIIFFGLNDLNLFQQYLLHQQSQQKDNEGSVILSYKRFDNLANALHYVQTPTNENEQDDTVARKPPAEKEPERRSARKKKSAAVNNNNNNNDQERSETTQQKRPTRKKGATATAITNPPSDAEEPSTKKTSASLKKTRKKAPKKTNNQKTPTTTTTTVTPLLPIQPRPLVPLAPRPVDEPQVAEAAGQDVDTTTTTTTTTHNKSGQEPPQERTDDNIAPTTMTTTTTNAMLPGPRPMVQPLPPSRPAEGEQQGRETTAGNNNNSNSKIGRPRGYRNAWEENFQLLVDFKQEYGHLKIPSRKVNIPNPKYHVLIYWARKQRKEFTDFQPPPPSEMSLSDQQKLERRQKLQDLGFEIWYKPNRVAVNRQESFNKIFQKRLNQLKEFKAKHGHVNVPNGTSLYTWLFSQRKTYRAATTTQQQQNNSSSSPNVSLLTLEHIGALKDLGVTMELSYNRTSTRQAVQEYVDFVKRHRKFPDLRSTNHTESKLARASGKWRQMRGQFEETNGGDTTTTTNANDQETTNCGNSNNNTAAAASSSSRTSRDPGNHLSQDLIDALDSVNFRWIMKKKKTRTKPRADINNATPWETKFQALKAYIDKYGMEPTIRHKVLGDFVKQIRKEYNYMVKGKRSTLTLERFRKLTQAGFRFKVGRQRRYGFEGSDGGESSGGEGEAAAAAVEEPDDAFFGTTDNNNNNYNHHDLWAAYTRRSL